MPVFINDGLQCPEYRRLSLCFINDNSIIETVNKTYGVVIK